MTAARGYNKYPEAVKLQIAKSKNPYLFPEYNIPRTTALYWIQTAPETALPIISDQSLAASKIKALEKELGKEKSLTSLVETIRSIFPYSFREQRVPGKPVRRKIIEAIKTAAKSNNVCDCLKLIGLARSTYSNWLSEFYLCEDSKGRCKQRKPHQLTHDEIDTMSKLVTSKKYSHFLIQSLRLYAQRKGLLFCSLDSWYKYKKIFGWNRPRGLKKEKSEQVGIRAKRPNEIWHVDVTQVKIANKRVIYIQVIYDNFSRYVLAWKVTTDISAVNTVDLIATAKRQALVLGETIEPLIMSDGGPENDNHKVLNFLNSKNIQRLIARADIHFSNSMVESLFRMLKSNYLSYTTLRSIDDVERKIEFFFSEHNNVIPRQVFKGATPKEIFLGSWTEIQAMELKAGLKASAEKRKTDYRAMSCGGCKSTLG